MCDDEAKENFGYYYGAGEYKITLEDIEALKQGKCLAATINCNEYSIFISLED